MFLKFLSHYFHCFCFCEALVRHAHLENFTIFTIVTCYSICMLWIFKKFYTISIHTLLIFCANCWSLFTFYIIKMLQFMLRTWIYLRSEFNWLEFAVKTTIFFYIVLFNKIFSRIITSFFIKGTIVFFNIFIWCAILFFSWFFLPNAFSFFTSKSFSTMNEFALISFNIINAGSVFTNLSELTTNIFASGTNLYFLMIFISLFSMFLIFFVSINDLFLGHSKQEH